MKKIVLFFVLGLFLASVSQAALPVDLEMNVTFDYFSLSSDGVSYETIVGTPTTVNLLASETQSTEGSSVVITPPSAGTYHDRGRSTRTDRWPASALPAGATPWLKESCSGPYGPCRFRQRASCGLGRYAAAG